jgi:hypothetical protein
MDTIGEAHQAADRLRAKVIDELLRYGMAVRQDADGRTTPEQSLLATIKANVDNRSLSDQAFRQFIRNSLG